VVGYASDRLWVNGMFGPTWRAPRQWVRLRLLNGCNTRILVLRLSDATPVLQIANEAGVLVAPLTRGTLTLAPGERAEIQVEFSSAGAGQVTRLVTRSAGRGMGMGMGMGMGAATGTEVTALTMRINLPRQPGAISSPPARVPPSGLSASKAG